MKTTNKGACATCVKSLTWHEVKGSQLVYFYGGKTHVVGGMDHRTDGRSPRAYCPEHFTVACSECEGTHAMNDTRCPLVAAKVLS